VLTRCRRGYSCDWWSRKHAHTQRRLSERFAEPVIGMVTRQDIKTGRMQQIVNAAPTAGETASTRPWKRVSPR